MTASLSQSISSVVTSVTSPWQWRAAPWQDYLVLRDAPSTARMRLDFDRNPMKVSMGGEGMNHVIIQRFVHGNAVPVGDRAARAALYFL